MNLINRDKNVIWHPFTQHKMAADPIAIKRAQGAYIYDENNHAYLDLISSWWVNLHGHAHPDIAEAIYQQALQLEHVIFSGFTHESAVQLAEKMLSHLPNHFHKVFYSDNGSTAVEVALKMAYQYWRNKNEPQRKRFLSFKNAYHGDTFGAMAVGKYSGFYAPFEDLLFSVDMFDYPATWLNDEKCLEKENATLQQLENHLELYANETAALIIEPLVQGSSGMHMCTPRFLQALELLLRKYNVLIIYDEVMTGFGRTGELFACLKAQTQPDIICLAKGITGGFLPLAATVCSDTIFNAFQGDSFANALAHGHSYTANPLGCAAGLASFKILESEATQQQIQMIERVHNDTLENLTEICKPRYCGTIAAFELNTADAYGSRQSLQLRTRMLERGLLVRPLGNTIYFLPPYCIKESELRNAYAMVMQEITGVIV